MVKLPELGGIDFLQLFSGNAERPVAGTFAGGVEPGVAAVQQKVLYRQNQQAGMAGEHGPEDVVVASVNVVAVVAHIVEQLTALGIVHFPDVAQQGVVVVGAGIGDGVVVVVVRQMWRTAVAQKSKLQYTHTGETAVLHQLIYFRCDIAEVLGNQQFIAASSFQGPAWTSSAPLDPFAFFGRGFAGRDGPVGFQSAVIIIILTR